MKSKPSTPPVKVTPADHRTAATRIRDHFRVHSVYILLLTASLMSLAAIQVINKQDEAVESVERISSASSSYYDARASVRDDGLPEIDTLIDNLPVFSEFNTVQDDELKHYLVDGGVRLHSSVLETGNGATSTSREIGLIASKSVVNCKTIQTTIPDKTDERREQEINLSSPLVLTLEDGAHNFTTTCIANGETIVGGMNVLVIDNQPEECSTHTYTKAARTRSTTVEGVSADIIGDWSGCALSPWIADYAVKIRFESDGSYSASSTETLDQKDISGGFYTYSSSEEDDRKLYSIDSVANGLAQGNIDIVHPSGNTVQRGEIRNIRLSGDLLSFDFYHQGQYGPIEFELIR